LSQNLLKIDDLKTWLHRDLSQGDKLLLILGSFDAPCSIAAIKKCAGEAGFRRVKDWNVSGILGRTKGLAINTHAGWELSDSGKQHLNRLGVGKINPAAVQLATDLRALLAKVNGAETRAFLEEAVQCYEMECYRSAVVMSWLAAFHVLKTVVHQKHLKAFNTEAHRVDLRWKTAKTTDDLGLMKEGEFLDRMAAISVIGKNVKTDLKKALDLRNACGHPNSYRLGERVVSSHIESLLLNVFQPFC
jgi:hypothetical protein